MLLCCRPLGPSSGPTVPRHTCTGHWTGTLSLVAGEKSGARLCGVQDQCFRIVEYGGIAHHSVVLLSLGGIQPQQHMHVRDISRSCCAWQAAQQLQHDMCVGLTVCCTMLWRAVLCFAGGATAAALRTGRCLTTSSCGATSPVKSGRRRHATHGERTWPASRMSSTCSSSTARFVGNFFLGEVVARS
jgi:hypothetical protein